MIPRRFFIPMRVREREKKKTSACFWTTSINNPFLAAGSAEWITDSVIRTFCCPLPLLYPPEHLPSKLLSAEQDNASVAVVKEGRSRRRKGEWNNIWQGKKRWVITYSISRAEPNTLLEAKCFSNQALFTIYQLIIKGERNTNKNKKRQFSFWYISLQTEAERRWAVLACSNIVCGFFLFSLEPAGEHLILNYAWIDDNTDIRKEGKTVGLLWSKQGGEWKRSRRRSSRDEESQEWKGQRGKSDEGKPDSNNEFNKCTEWLLTNISQQYLNDS